MLIEYIKDRKGNRVGTIVGVCEEWEDTVRVGWSYCNKADKFDKLAGVEIAYWRAVGGGKEKCVPRLIQKRLPGFVTRCYDYFRQANYVDCKALYNIKNKRVGQIKIVSEKDVQMVDMVIDMDNATYDMLIDYAKKHILKDIPSMINWAFNDIIKNQINGG